MIRIKSSAKLPIETFWQRGSYDQRLEYARKLNAKFFNLTKDEFKKGSISVIDYKKALSSILPENIKIHVANISKNEIEKRTRAYVSYNITNDNVNYTTVYFPYMNKHGKKNKNARISADLKGTIAHENFHIFAGLANPKHLARNNSFLNKDYEIYEECLYGPHAKISPSRIKLFIKHLNSKSTEEKIDFLQSCRYHLLEENFAFMEEDKYQYRKYPTPEYSFVEKIIILEKLLAFYLKKARYQNKKLLKKTKEAHSS